ncbi:MAG: hypothetical protein PCFJNLEI_02292 [Verrucomicrobiae bacterium]|nr:hypothetical protein [Verrucomicrobiae bacterium]
MKRKILIPCGVAVVLVIALALWPRRTQTEIATQNTKEESRAGVPSVAGDSRTDLAPVSSSQRRSDLPVATGSAISAGNSHAREARTTPTGRAAYSVSHIGTEPLAADLPDPVATATIRVGDQTFRERSNEHGVFNVIRIQERQQVALEVAFGAGDPGQRVVAMVEDGGTLRDGQRVLPMQLDAQLKVAFDFTASENRGVYRIRLRRGTETKMVQFWAGEPLALASR